MLAGETVLIVSDARDPAVGGGDHEDDELVDWLTNLGYNVDTSGMGGAMQEGGHRRESFDSNGVLRGGKRDLWEGGIRTPMIAWWPGTIQGGRTTDHISAFWDISPTVRELAGADPQVDTDGISMVPTFLGEGEQTQHDYLFWQLYEQGGKRAIRQGKWKLVEYDTVISLAPKVELFNLEEDISELNDVADLFPEKVMSLQKLMTEAHVLAEHPNFRNASELKPERRERLARAVMERRERAAQWRNKQAEKNRSSSGG